MAEPRPCASCRRPLAPREGEGAAAFASRRTCGRACGSRLGARTRGAARTAKTPYRSLYSELWLTPAAFLAESLCARLARHAGRHLPPRFWELEGWKRHYAGQMRHAAALLRAHSVADVCAALRTREGQKVRSLGAPWLPDLVALEERRLALLREAAPPPPPPTAAAPGPAPPPRPAFAPVPSPLSKLKGL